MNADKSREIAENYWLNECKKVDKEKLDLIINQIVDEAKKGKYYLTINERLDDLILNNLGLLGFRWSIEDHMFMTLTNIYWSRK